VGLDDALLLMASTEALVRKIENAADRLVAENPGTAMDHRYLEDAEDWD
jgi:hypothetical protein